MRPFLDQNFIALNPMGSIAWKVMGGICKVTEKWAKYYKANQFQQKRVILWKDICVLPAESGFKNREFSKRQEKVWLSGAATYLVNCWLPASVVEGCGAH